MSKRLFYPTQRIKFAEISKDDPKVIFDKEGRPICWTCDWTDINTNFDIEIYENTKENPNELTSKI